jgi:hypothetical protein
MDKQNSLFLKKKNVRLLQGIHLIDEGEQKVGRIIYKFTIVWGLLSVLISEY